MKKILLFFVLFLIVPIVVILLLFKIDQSKYKFQENQKVRVYISKIKKIIEVPIEEYVIGVVAGEMPLSFQDEALKVQSVLARTYVMRKIIDNKNSKFDVYDDTRDQVYYSKEHLKQVWKSNYLVRYTRLERIVNSTYGEYISYKNNPIYAYYFSTSSGKTENSEDVFGVKLPYLKSVDSSFDNISPYYKKNITMDKVSFFKEFNTASNSTVLLHDKTDSNRYKYLKINDTNYSTVKVREILKLPSANFLIHIKNDEIVIECYGHGHGVGLSQYGANQLALNKKTYDQIIKYYYKNVIIKNMYN